jgi:two-component system, OmpR family, response regulator CpxR
MGESPRVLVIDDDVELCELLTELLGQEGYPVESVNDGRAGLSRAESENWSLVVLDVMLPSMSGFEILTRLRATSRVPIIMLTARGEDVDRIVGLEMGADDYLPKPFNPRELVARVRAIHRRLAVIPQETSNSASLVVDDLELFAGSRRIERRKEELHLTTAEYDLLEILMRNGGAVVSREELTRVVLGRRLAAFDRAIDMHVSNLRRKLGPAPSGSERIKTVRNAGYLLTKEHA